MADEGASPKEQILEAARRNNTELLHDVLNQLTKQAKTQRQKPEDLIAQTLNSARDGIGMGAIHLAALNGNYDVLDLLLDQEGVEIDELDRLDKDTPLHKAVRYANDLNKADWEVGQQIADILIDAGCDPRIRNGAKLRPFELVDPRNTELRKMLQQAEFSIQAGDDVVVDDDDAGPAGSGSESD